LLGLSFLLPLFLLGFQLPSGFVEFVFYLFKFVLHCAEFFLPSIELLAAVLQSLCEFSEFVFAAVEGFFLFLGLELLSFGFLSECPLQLLDFVVLFFGMLFGGAFFLRILCVVIGADGGSFAVVGSRVARTHGAFEAFESLVEVVGDFAEAGFFFLHNLTHDLTALAQCALHGVQLFFQVLDAGVHSQNFRGWSLRAAHAC